MSTPQAAELVWDCACLLGEGPVWNAADASIYFVDIKGAAVLAYTPRTGAKRRWPMPDWIGWLHPWRDGRWVAGLRRGVYLLALEPTVRLEPLCLVHPPGSPMRLNDGKIDPRGRLWFGSMHDSDPDSLEGRLFRLHDSGSSVTALAVDLGYRIANGPAFSADGRTLWHTDSAARTIYAFDLDAEGTPTNKRVWARFGGAAHVEGFPDGMACDAGGDLWIARWGAGFVSVHRRDGTELRRLSLPATQVSSLTFGGEQLEDLYVTTARIGLAPEALQDQPQAGGLFRLRGCGRGLAPQNWLGSPALAPP